MTNAEKFEEVFGIKIDENYPAGICQSIDHIICIEHSNCSNCPAFKFWDKEYEAKPYQAEIKDKSMKIWITTYWTTEIEPVVTPFDNKEAADTCARYYEKQGYKVCIDECVIFHKCIEQVESEDK